MKKIFLYIILMVAVCGFQSCSDFLKESSQDEVRPSTIEELEQLLLGEGYIKGRDIFNYLELLTDNVQNGYTSEPTQLDFLMQGAPVYKWDKDMYEQMAERNVIGHESWETLYKYIMGCNVVLDMIPKVDGTEDNLLNQKGQALALRAFYYFMLVNTYAEPYNKEGIDRETALGVPLMLTPAIKDEFPPRASISKVYQQIEKDLLEASDLMHKYGNNNINYKVTPLFTDLLLSRVYLFMENWKKSAEYASKVIERKPQLMRLSNYYIVDEWFGTAVYDKEKGGVYNADSPELIWGYSGRGSNDYFYHAPNFGTPGSPVFSASDELKDLYEPGDIRAQAFYKEYFIDFMFGIKGLLCGEKGSPSSLSNSQKGMRVAEAYLSRAEANIRMALENGDASLKAKALEDLNYLRSFRFDRYQEVEISDDEKLLQFCLDERRREMAFEDMRWFDLRRLGMPEIKHIISYEENNPQEIVLKKGSDRYTLPISKKVLDQNPALVQNS